MKKEFTALCLSFALFLSLVIAKIPTTHAQQTAAAQSAPQTLKLMGLRDRVTVRRDERGIPYIEAKNDLDLYFAQGYVTASDRLWQMDLMRRTARGELSEIFGNTTLDTDKQHRTYGFAQEADAEIAGASSQTLDGFKAYASGVNAYINSLDDKSLPPEFQILQYKPRAWTPGDSVLVVKLFAEELSTSWPLDARLAAFSSLAPEKRAALFPETSPLDVLVVGTDDAKKKSGAANPTTQLNQRDALAILQTVSEMEETMKQTAERIGLYAEFRAASNNWVVSGAHTASGKPLLANDPHLGASAPSIWYMVHLTAPGVRVAGVTAPGLPGVVIGHNDRIAWGFTNVGPDVQDLYIEKFDPQNPKRYMTPAGWQDAQIRHEEIKVRKGFTSTETDTVPLDVTITRHGPIILEKNGTRFALRWTALDPKFNDISGFHALNRARNWKEYVAALRTYTGPMQNMIYADVDGHIGHYAPGRAPIRKSGDGSLPYDGSTDAGEWTGMIPFDELPHIYDPPSGIIVTANQRIVGTSYPHFLSHAWAAPYRARRIYNLLTAKQKLTADDFRAIQGDIYTISGKLFAQEFVKALSNAGASDAKLAETVKLLADWDGRMSADSRAALLVNNMRFNFTRRIATAALGPDLVKEYGWPGTDTLIDRIVQEHPSDWLPKEFKDYSELFRAVYDDARKNLAGRFGEDDTKWTWGRAQQIRFPHPLAAAPLIGLQFTIQPIPMNGSGGGNTTTVNVGRNVSMRFIADPSDWDKTQHGITLGESGLPTSPHWSDQLSDWTNVTPRAFPFTIAAIEKAAKETITLEPATQ